MILGTDLGAAEEQDVSTVQLIRMHYCPDSETDTITKVRILNWILIPLPFSLVSGTNVHSKTRLYILYMMYFSKELISGGTERAQGHDRPLPLHRPRLPDGRHPQGHRQQASLLLPVQVSHLRFSVYLVN